MKKMLLFICVLGFLIQSSCVNDKYVPEVVNNRCDTTYYSRTIKPIIINNCAISGCHDGHSTLDDFNNYAEVKVVVEEIEDGESAFLHRIKLPLNEPGHMPVGKILLPSDIQLIENWIKSGSPGC